MPRKKRRKGGRTAKKSVAVRRVDERTYLADSQSQPGKQYGLKLDNSGWLYECLYHQNRHGRCKYIRAVEADAGKATKEAVRLAPVTNLCPAYESVLSDVR